ncbi:related to SNX41-sorting nexin, mediate distinct retrieval pathways from endosomes [Sporisorium scitamineum]|uniref:Related to SNX41-sorting nexin, mediate distinct retrieval pathways from endosomes n=1 Tax=Sporisorium scitamineum TaxID=49012 RepID=A0A0F7RWT9_9BASI|nr:related to SNX41-sorting nexin, mediate distinct retrieval pathways from endosomes [Sporisorium scitamineum]CDS01481.1 hypothetical protein [Sporisorium scitamineum]
MSSGHNDDMNPFQIPEDENKASGANQASAASSHSSLRNGTNEAHPSASNGAQGDDDDQGWTGSSSRAQMTASADASSNANRPSAPSSTHRATFASPPSIIEIIDAQKSGDGGSSFIVYVIQNGTTEAKRRYSEFEALREALIRLHPTIIIAPIPSKHTLSDYAAKQSKAKEDATIIARRKRMLQSFLRRCDNHPKLRGDEVLQKFLDGRYSWNDITASPPLIHLPKNNLRAPVQNPADPHASPAYAHLPLPSSVSSLRHPNQRFIDSEAFTNRFANHLSGSMEKVNRRLMRRWTEASTDYAELGAILNGFSLTESGQLATAIERTGQAADAAYIATGQMLKQWEEKFTEPLHEYTQFAAILQKLLKWRHLKHLQYELAQDALEAKKTQLEELERVENEAKRLEEALERGGAGLVSGGGRVTGGGIDANGIRDGVGSGFRPSASVYGRASGEEGDNSNSSNAKGRGNSNGNGDAAPSTTEANGAGSARSRPTSPPSSPSKRSSSRSTGYGLLGAITHTFQSVMDVDRDASRRSNISKLREEISLLEEGLSLTANDLHYATTAIQADLDRFQRQKVSDLKEMMLDFAKMHREFAQANLDNWKEAKQEIDAVEKPAGMPESSLVRRDREGVSTPGAGARRKS